MSYREGVGRDREGTTRGRAAAAQVVGLVLVFLLRISALSAALQTAALGQTTNGGGETQGAAEKPIENAWVIPAGKEDVLADMLGRGETLPGPCQFSGGQADRTSLRGTYSCPGGEVVFELSHPSKAAPGATQTERFAIKLQSGSPPAGLADALVARVRAHEAAFEWTWIGSTAPTRSPLRVVGGLLVALALVVGGVLMILRRRQRQRAEP